MKPTKDKGARLPKRELEILNLIKFGYPNKRIAFELNISEHTVKQYITRLMEHLDAGNRAHYVYLGLKQDLID